MNKAAKNYNSQGLELVNAGRLEVAIDFFTKAIEEDPAFLEAYKNRGETLIKLNRTDEGEKDIQKAERSKKKPAKTSSKPKKAVAKYNLNDVEDLWGSVLSEESSDSDEDLFLDDLLYGDDFSGDDASGNEQTSDPYEQQFEDDTVLYDDDYPEKTSGNNQAFDSYGQQSSDDTDLYDENYSDDTSDNEGVVATDVEKFARDTLPLEETLSDDAAGDEQIPGEAVLESSEAENSAVVLEYIGGTRQEVTHARLFEPQENTILLTDKETNDEVIVFFDQLACLRISNLPPGISGKQKKSCTKEVIETVDGNIYNELVLPGQDLDNLLICFSADHQTPFPVTLFPKSNIKKRTQDKQLTDILLEKRFISKMILQKALQEFDLVKSLTLEKIIAQKAHIPLAEIEEALDQAKENQLLGLQKEEILLISGIANEEEILDAVERLEYISKLEMNDFFVEKGIVTEREVYISLAEKHKIPFVDLKGRKLSKKSLASLPESLVLNHEILPLAMRDDILLVATHSVDAAQLSEAIIKAAGCKDVKFVLSQPTDIRKIIHLVYGN